MSVLLVFVFVYVVCVADTSVLPEAVLGSQPITWFSISHNLILLFFSVFFTAGVGGTLCVPVPEAATVSLLLFQCALSPNSVLK